MEYTELSIQNGVILFAGLMMLSGIVFTLWDTEKKSNQELVA